MRERKELVTKRLKELRREHHYTMEVLAEKIGVTKSAISKWESGLVENMRQDSIDALAELYNVSPGYIMGWTDDENEKPHEEEFTELYNQLNVEQKSLVDNMIKVFLSKQ